MTYEPKRRGRPPKKTPIVEAVAEPPKKRGRPPKPKPVLKLDAVEMPGLTDDEAEARANFYESRSQNGRIKICKKTGRPILTKLQERWKFAGLYYPEIGLEMVEFFEERAADMANFPTFEGFAVSRGVTRALLCKWAKDEKKPEFTRYYDICLAIQADTTIVRGMTGFANARFAETFGRIFLKWTEKEAGDDGPGKNGGAVQGFDIKMIGAGGGDAA